MLPSKLIVRFNHELTYCFQVTWMKWDEIPLTVSDAVAKGWSLRDKCQGKLKN